MRSRRADRLAVADQQNSCSDKSDWADSWRSFALLWGLPGLAMVLATFFEPPTRTVVWTASLLWMGGACLVNVHRCNRTHCHFTGPFFMLMAMAVVAYAIGILPFGPHGWSILGAVTMVGTLGLWWASERIWGKFFP